MDNMLPIGQRVLVKELGIEGWIYESGLSGSGIDRIYGVRLDEVAFPVRLPDRILACFPSKNLILFLGSGTTAYCAKKLNRKCIGIEIEEKYCEIAANRCSQSVMELDI